MEPTWEMLDKAERDARWDVVYGRFAFRPHMQQFPGFAEPGDSVTFSLSGMYGVTEEHYWRVRRACGDARIRNSCGSPR